MSAQGKFVLIATNAVSTVATCGFASLYTTFSLVADTVPLAAAVQENFTKNSDAVDSYGYTGGLGALIIDLTSFVLDITDAQMDDVLFEELPKAYDETRAAANLAFNDNYGYCADQAQQLVILLGLR